MRLLSWSMTHVIPSSLTDFRNTPMGRKILDPTVDRTDGLSLVVSLKILINPCLLLAFSERFKSCSPCVFLPRNLRRESVKVLRRSKNDMTHHWPKIIQFSKTRRPGTCLAFLRIKEFSSGSSWRERNKRPDSQQQRLRNGNRLAERFQRVFTSLIMC